MITFIYLNKNEKDIFLPKLFDLLYDNMHEIAPTELSYEHEKKQWFDNVSPALDKPARQIIMCFADNKLVGYIQYYINNKLLMIEELQLKKEYHCTLTFYRFCNYFIGTLPADIEYVEAFAEKRNSKSQKLMQRLGMVLIDSNAVFVHLRGNADELIKKIYIIVSQSRVRFYNIHGLSFYPKISAAASTTCSKVLIFGTSLFIFPKPYAAWINGTPAKSDASQSPCVSPT